MEILRDIQTKLPSGDEDDNKYFDLEGFPSGQLSPPFADSIPMDVDFSPTPFINGFVRNILHREIRLTVEAWRNIIGFCTRRDFSDVSSRICLQILFLYSKADPVELEKCNSNYNNMFEKRVAPYLEGFRAEKMDIDETEKVKKILSLPVIANALKASLEDVIGRDFDETKLPGAIESMNFYKGNVAFRFRGVSLFDGIFINYASICNYVGYSEQNEADLITIVGHETVHHLARKLSNNYNFSTPFSGRFGGVWRKDPLIVSKNLELGRLLELKIFGFQPNWFTADPKAASKFLRMVADPSSRLPLIIGPGLDARPASLSFGFDPAIEFENDVFMC